MTVWLEPLGVDFSDAFVDGLTARLKDTPPEEIASVIVLLPTRRMARRVTDRLADGGATLLPRIELVSDLSPLVPYLPLPPARTSLSLRLELATLVDPLLAARPDLAPRSAVLDLASTLADLLQEMKEEGVGAAGLDAIDADPLAAHWQHSLQFLRIVTAMVADSGVQTTEDVQALCLDALREGWASTPPGRVIVAGSTGSRGPTLRLMQAVASMPMGDVILPGVDTEMPGAAWNSLDNQAQDHPQFRHRAFLESMGLSRAEVAQWSGREPATVARNKLISLALRPPPATHAWLSEGPKLAPVAKEACAGLTLVEAATTLEEAETIALRLRQAVEDGTRAALISPDRTLSRMVAACLDRWDLIPDDSAGRPLDLSPPGRLLVQTARLRGRPVESETLVALLKHPLAHTGTERREHLLRTRDAEVDWLRGGPLHPDATSLAKWFAKKNTRGVDDGWSAWLLAVIEALHGGQRQAPLAAHVAEHRKLLTLVATGSPQEETKPDGALWDEAAGRAALDVMERLATDAEGAGALNTSADDYARFLHSLLSAQEVRTPDAAHPGIMIWGALEARVQGADLVILGGLNDGTWPSLPGPDMWLSRQMRASAGLRAPERTVGLSAHDFEQAVAGKQVWLTRATRSADAQTVPSRWLNRLTSLLGGIGAEGKEALAAMRERGAAGLAAARSLGVPRTRHNSSLTERPAPIPPVAARPQELSVTQVETLIRDPYAIYARHVLGLRPLDPLRPPSDPAMRGSVMHDAIATFGDDAVQADAMLDILRNQLRDAVPGAARRALWLGRFARVADAFATQEAARRAKGRAVVVEDFAKWPVPGTQFTLTAKADRIDLRDGAAAIFDYKTGKPPTPKQQDFYAKQLILEALMVEHGAFAKLGTVPVEEVAYLGIGGQGGALETKSRTMTPELRVEALDGLRKLIAQYTADAPYPARLAPEFIAFSGDYDHLSRLGEWDDTKPAKPSRVG